MLIKNVFWIITFLLTWCRHIPNNDITPATSQNYIWHAIANKLYSLNCWYYSVVHKKLFIYLAGCSMFPHLPASVWQYVYKNPVPNWWFSFPFHRKNYNPLLLPCPLLSHLTSSTPTKSNLYLANSLAAAVNEPALYRLLSFQVPNLMSLFRWLGRTKVLIQVRGKGSWFATKTVFAMRGFQHIAQTPSWRTIPCRLPATAYSIYSPLPSILQAVPPSANQGRAKP